MSLPVAGIPFLVMPYSSFRSVTHPETFSIFLQLSNRRFSHAVPAKPDIAEDLFGQTLHTR